MKHYDVIVVGAGPIGLYTAGLCEKLGLEVIKADLQRIPNNPTEIDDEAMADLEKLIEKLEDDEDVQTVYTNIA